MQERSRLNTPKSLPKRSLKSIVSFKTACLSPTLINWMTKICLHLILHQKILNQNCKMKHLDTFVQYKPRHTIIFMEVLEVTDTIDTKEICNVSWYIVCKDEIIIQSDFPMCATDGEFVNFVPIPRHSFLEVRRLIKKIRKEQMFVPKNDKTAPSEFKQAYRKARRKIIQIIKKAQ